MKKIIEIKKSIDTLYIYWTLTDFCNFKCNYCPSTLHDGVYANGLKPGFPSDIQINTFIDNLITTHLKGRQLYLIISGGEPTVHPMFPIIIERLSPYGFIGINTNGARPFEWWNKLTVLPSLITISLHPEFTKIDKINKLSHYLLEKNVELNFNLSCDTKHWEESISLYQGLDDILKTMTQPKVLNYLGTQDRDRYEYSIQQEEFMNSAQELYDLHRKGKPMLPSASDRAIMTFEDGNSRPVTNIAELTMNRLNNFFQWNCSAGSSGINVNFDGNVWAGICKIKNLGKIESFNLLNEYVECNRKFCPCPGDIRLNKYNPAVIRQILS
jgi:MoaA/NifB/PqqE/SkfB family radical SAM enzyme